MAGHVTSLGEKRGEFWVLVVKPEGKKPLGKSKGRWSIILRCIFRKWYVGEYGLARAGSG